MTQYNEQKREYGPGYVMVADVQGSKGGEREGGKEGWLASVVTGNGWIMCVCVREGGGWSVLDDLFIKFSKPEACLFVDPQQ